MIRRSNITPWSTSAKVALGWILVIAIIGALAPFLSNSRPYFIQDPSRGRIFPLFAALTTEDKFWLWIVLSPLIFKLSRLLAVPLGRWWTSEVEHRCGQILFGSSMIAAAALCFGTATTVDPHAYRREKEVRNELAIADARLLADPIGDRASTYHSVCTELRRDAAALADLQAEVGERLTMIDGFLAQKDVAASQPRGMENRRLPVVLLERLAELVRTNTLRSTTLASATFAPLAVGAVELDRRAVSLVPFASAAHPLGTDHRGRDLAAILIHGTRTSMTIGIFSVALALLIGIAAGAAAGIGPAWLDGTISLAIKAMMALPVLSILLVLVAYLPPNRSTMIVVLAMLLWPSIARLVRSEVSRLVREEFVLAVRALGAGSIRVFFLHLLPMLRAPLLVHSALAVGSVVLAESTLDFLGLAAPDAVGWGGMIAASRRSPSELWHFAAFPGAMLVGLIVALNVVGRARSGNVLTAPR